MEDFKEGCVVKIIDTKQSGIQAEYMNTFAIILKKDPHCFAKGYTYSIRVFDLEILAHRTWRVYEFGIVKL
jgi:hypothetical protein